MRKPCTNFRPGYEKIVHYLPGVEKLDLRNERFTARAEGEFRKKAFTPEEYDKLLSHYSSIGDEKAVRALLQRGVNVDEKNLFKETPLVCADFSKPNIVKLLLDAGANVNAANEDGQRPLHLAVMKNSLASVKLLIQAKADVRVKDNSHEIPLNYAIQNGSLDIIKVLLEVTQKFEVSNLNLAVESSNEEIVKLLLDCNINVNDETLYGDFPLYFASCQSNLNITRFLLDYGANVNKMHKRDGVTAIHRAAKMGHIEQIKLLIQRGANVNVKTFFDMTPLHYATRIFRDNTYDIAKLLIQHGASCDVRSKFVATPLYYALVNYNRQVKGNEFLLEHGANFEPRDSHSVAMNLHVDVVDLLLDNGFDINALYNGVTALHFAIEMGLAEACELLLNRGADIDRKTNNMTPLEYISKDYDRRQNGKRIKNVFVKHVAKQKFQNFLIDKQNEEIINNNPESKEYYLLCVQELRKIDKYQILNDFSLSQLLFKSKNNIIGYAKNEELVRAYESSMADLQDNFPIYFTDNFRKFFGDQITKQRQIKKTIDKLCNIFHTNYVVNKNIVKYLKAENLDYINNM